MSNRNLMEKLDGAAPAPLSAVSSAWQAAEAGRVHAHLLAQVRAERRRDVRDALLVGAFIVVLGCVAKGVEWLVYVTVVHP